MNTDKTPLETESKPSCLGDVSGMLPIMVAVGMAIQFKEWCDNHAWEEDYREQKTHTTGQLFDIWNKSVSNYR